MELKKVKDRIQKLLAMANDLSSPNEAAIASVRVQKLMAKYNLEMADLIAEELKDEENIVKGEGYCRYKRTPAYIQWINVAIAEAFNCETRRDYKLINGKEYEVSRFYGYKTDVDVAISMNDYICDQLERMAKRVKIPEPYRENGMGRRYMADWRKGAAREINNRILDFYGVNEQGHQAPTTSSGQSLSILKKDFIAKKFGNFSYGQTVSYRYTDDGIADGGIAAKSISINKKVQDQKYLLPST